MIIIGTFCLIYYLMLRLVTRKWNSTFAWFWLCAGTLSLCLGMILEKHQAWSGCAEWKLLSIPVAVFLVVECTIFLGMRPSGEEALPYIIVLGAQVQGRRITDSLMRRLERARLYLKKYPETVVIVSGGQGKGEEVSEAEAMEEYLVLQGIAKERIIREEQSTTTRENLKFSAKYIIDRSVPVGIVTNNFHMYRAVCTGKKLGYQDLRRLPAGCHSLLFVNYVVREFFAVIKTWIFH